MGDRLDRLKTLLQRERQHLLGGDLTALTTVLEEKTTLLQGLATPGADRVPPELLHQMSRNQDLLAAALTGLREAQDRVRDIAATREGLKTYRATGEVLDIAFTRHHALDRKD